MTVAELEAAPPRARGFRRLARRFARHRPAVAGLVVAVVFTLAAVFAPLVAPAPPDRTVFAEVVMSHMADHGMTTDPQVCHYAANTEAVTTPAVPTGATW